MLEQCQANTHIDYFSLDVEGAELEALLAIDFDRVQIDVFTIETNEHDKAIKQFLVGEKGYHQDRQIGADKIFVHRNAQLSRSHLADAQALVTARVVSPALPQHLQITNGSIQIRFEAALEQKGRGGENYPAEKLPRAEGTEGLVAQLSAQAAAGHTDQPQYLGIWLINVPSGQSEMLPTRVHITARQDLLRHYSCCAFTARVFDEWGLLVAEDFLAFDVAEALALQGHEPLPPQVSVTFDLSVKMIK